MFISFDGGDGVGKSTQRELLKTWFEEHGRKVTLCRDPGSTDLSERVREILLHSEHLRIDATAEMLLYMTARAQLTDEIIRPALERGEVVLSDRFLLSNVVYQGYGREMGTEQLWLVGKIATGGILPDLSIVLDAPLDVTATRVGEERDRMESLGDDFHQRVRKGFLAEAVKDPKRIAVVDACGTIKEIQTSIREVIGKLED